VSYWWVWMIVIFVVGMLWALGPLWKR